MTPPDPLAAKLRSCPFCESVQIIIAGLAANEDLRGYCKACGAKGEAARTKQEAAELWNTRPLEDALLAALRKLLIAYESIMPGIKYIAVQDYALLNDAPCEAHAAIELATPGRGER